MKKTKAEKGITLIALIITIVVLLILAAVAISSIQNDGILHYAQNAADSWNKAQINEQATLDSYLSYLDNLKYQQCPGHTYVEGVCSNCGYKCLQHNWKEQEDSSNYECEICGLVCEHENIDSDFYYDEQQHGEDYYCLLCRRLMIEYSGSTPHYFDETGKCIGDSRCPYVCTHSSINPFYNNGLGAQCNNCYNVICEEHSWINGTCEKCNYECTHDISVETKYVSNGTTGHDVSETCVCGKPVVTYTEPHSGDVPCSLCGWECTHENKYLEEELDDEGNLINSYYVCNDCYTPYV